MLKLCLAHSPFKRQLGLHFGNISPEMFYNFFQIIAYCERYFILKSVGARQEHEEKLLLCDFHLSLFQCSYS